MKKITLFIVLIGFLNLKFYSQSININQDPNGDPWMVCEELVITPEIQEELDQIPELILSPISAGTELSDVVDNSQNIFMRSIFNQGVSGCCHQAAGVSYTFTYEINRLRNLSSSAQENLYPTHYTYNFLNQGNGSSSSVFSSGWKIIIDNGCPNVITWGGIAGDPTRWMTGYDNYYSGMSNKIESMWYIPVNTEQGFLTLKHWINDHNEGDDIGGLSIFSIFLDGIDYDFLPPESADPGKSLIADWNLSSIWPHEMTFVGYNDNIKYDINNDGQFTNDIDTNGDGIVDMQDWEIGAMKVANSHGENYPTQEDGGFVYLPYRLLAKKIENPNQPGQYLYPIHEAKTHLIFAKHEYSPEIVIKANVQYPCRNKLTFLVGYANHAEQNDPVDISKFSSFKAQGGCLDMQGINTYPIEVGLDFGHWYANQDFGKVFFMIRETEGSNPYNGTIGYFSIIDYRWGEEFEIYCDETNVQIVNVDTTFLSINYDLIPHEVAIDEDLILHSDMVSRFNPTLTNGATLTFQNGVDIDMYDSEIHIYAGSSLVIEDNVTIRAKKGRCKLVINGDFTCGSYVNFIADQDADLDILINNNSSQVTFHSTRFQGVTFESFSELLSISNSEFVNCQMIASHRGIISVTNNSSFEGSYLYLENTEDDDNSVVISDCSFETEVPMTAIEIWNYNNYSISNNLIEGYVNGIQIMQSGFGRALNQMTNDNTINNCSNSGILAYGSKGKIHNNHILNNNYGIWLADHSNFEVYGDGNAVTYNQSQEIMDNNSYEVYTSQYSFPEVFRYNIIVDEDNLGGQSDPLIYHSVNGEPITKDISHNCWGINFDPLVDFYPNCFIWQPIWCPPDDEEQTGDAAEMYETAASLFNEENYSAARDIYETLIDQYPQSEFAKSSINDLFSLEQFTGSNYAELKTYFEENNIIQVDSLLKKNAVHLAKRCDIKLENWSPAIEYYENIILNPASMEDSIFAIINLGYIYFVMENSGLKAAYNGKLTQYKPESKQQFFEHRNYLLSLLPGDKKGEMFTEESLEIIDGTLLQNIPNPLKGNTQIRYSLEQESIVQVDIYNCTGQLIKTISEGAKSEGDHSIDFDAGELVNGIYFYTLSINGQVTDSKKMTVIK